MKSQAYFENIQTQIKKELSNAEYSIYIAVAWFTDNELFKVLCKKASEGLFVELIIVDDDINRQGSLNFSILESKGGKIWKIPTTDENLMHNKFCIIDDSTIITGSYNYTRKAQSNHENITVITDNNELAIQFAIEFFKLRSDYFNIKYNRKTFIEYLKPFNIRTSRMGVNKKRLLRDMFYNNELVKEEEENIFYSCYYYDIQSINSLNVFQKKQIKKTLLLFIQKDKAALKYFFDFLNEENKRYQEIRLSQIKAELKKAEFSIYYAVGWLSDKELFNFLCNKVTEGLFVEIIIYDESLNNENSINYLELEAKGGKVWIIPFSYELLKTSNYCIIDEKIIIKESYNYNNGEDFKDNIEIICDNVELVKKYTEEFFKIRQDYHNVIYRRSPLSSILEPLISNNRRNEQSKDLIVKLANVSVIKDLIIKKEIKIHTNKKFYDIFYYDLQSASDLAFDQKVQIKNLLKLFSSNDITSFNKFFDFIEDQFFDKAYTDFYYFRLVNHLIYSFIESFLIKTNFKEKVTYYNLLEYVFFSNEISVEYFGAKCTTHFGAKCTTF